MFNNSPWMNLSRAIVRQAIYDYVELDDEEEIANIEQFVNGDWFSTLTCLNPAAILPMMKDEHSARVLDEALGEAQRINEEYVSRNMERTEAVVMMLRMIRIMNK